MSQRLNPLEDPNAPGSPHTGVPSASSCPATCTIWLE